MLAQVLLAIEIIGVISFAVAGAIVAIDKETDLFGVVFLSLITCFGGGIIRDITIGRHPPAFFRELKYEVYSAYASRSSFSHLQSSSESITSNMSRRFLTSIIT